VANAILRECRNLRSQVTRPALQTMALLFYYVGRDVEKKLDPKQLDEIADFMLTKTADTNRFIRKDAKAAFTTIIDNITVAR
jgi:hypothetical protein